MTEPLYSVGQHVAVCTPNLSVVIPATTVLAVEYDKPGIYRDANSGNLGFFEGGYTYSVAGVPLSARGKVRWFRERYLRPINPDTEYLSTSTETPISQEMEQ